VTARLPGTRQMIAELIATPSVSSMHADIDTSNRGVIDKVAEWSESLGFEVELQAVAGGCPSVPTAGICTIY